MSVDEKTQTFYETQACLLAQRYESLPVPYPEEFLSYLKPGSSVLDLGSGSGRDLAFLLSKGHEVQGLEPSEAFIKEAYALHPELKGRIQQAALPQKHANLFGKAFDAVFVTAMIMHIADHDLFPLILQVKSWLKPGGLCILSASFGRTVDAGCRADDGRLFIERPKAEIQLLFERLGFSLLAERENADSQSREGIHWYSLIFRVQDLFSAAPADQLETIISRDRKDATYKLALLRALCDIAQGEPHQARFLPDHFPVETTKVNSIVGFEGLNKLPRSIVTAELPSVGDKVNTHEAPFVAVGKFFLEGKTFQKVRSDMDYMSNNYRVLYRN